MYNDIYPVTEGHTLVVPKQATQEDILKCIKFAVAMGQQNVEVNSNNVTGYNVGINMGESAGQTCMYPHIHLIFRRDGDMEDPKAASEASFRQNKNIKERNYGLEGTND